MTAQTTSQQPQPQPRQRKPPIRLPFEQRKTDIGEWAYDHRVGLCVTLIVYLSLAIVFVAGKIVLGKGAANQQITVVDLEMLNALEEQKVRLEEQARRLQTQQGGRVSNDFSNENARNESGEHARNISDNGDMSDVDERMRANREAWERGLAEERAIRDRANAAADEGAAGSSTRKAGRVTVSYDIRGREHRHLEVPAYRCEGGGEVVVAVRVAAGGAVTSAHVESGGDECMRTASLSAARRSTFNIDNDRSEGTITYMFIPQ